MSEHSADFDKTQQSPRSRSSMPRIAFAAVSALAVGLWISQREPLVWQKIVKELAMPLGICWLLLGTWLLQTWCSAEPRRWTSLLVGACWLCLSLFGSSFVGDALIGTLENQFVEQRPLQMERFDILIVLGGGTASSKSGRSQFGRGGDRVAVAAQMFHAQKVDKIIVTGANIAEFTGDRSGPADQAFDLLVSLGVDSDSIQKVGGRITLEEMRELANILPDDQRVGLITSAWHLPRALRRAKAAGLKLVPVPADFLTGPTEHSIVDHIPTWQGLQHSTLAVHEYLGMAVGR